GSKALPQPAHLLLNSIIPAPILYCTKHGKSLYKMKFTLSALTTSLLVSSLGPDVVAAHPKNLCTLTGYYDLQIVVGSGGPGQAPASSTRTWFGITVHGGKEKEFQGNSIGGRWQVIPSSKTGTAMDVSYVAQFLVGSYGSCKVSYNGKETSGKSLPGNGHGLGQNSAKCAVTFAC
ncbi:hypothetical protein TOPH_00362, partial [Tolypocladium ophioglossoides CBS 100239]